jgi:coatomer protein complex subunit alpha (xenin)
MIVFKLERERPAYNTHQGQLYYVKDRYLRMYDFQTQRDSPLISIRRAGSAGTNTVCVYVCACACACV